MKGDVEETGFHYVSYKQIVHSEMQLKVIIDNMADVFTI